MKGNLLGLGIIAAMLATSAAIAEPKAPGWYITGHGALVIPDDWDLEDPALEGRDGELELDTGFGLSAALGYRYGNGFRSEAEFLYRKNELDRIRVGGFGSTVNGQVDGDARAIAGMINGFYDVVTNTAWTPYAGVGLGVASINVDIDNPAVIRTDDSDAVFAYQTIAGIDYALSSRSSLGLRYRAFATTDPDFGSTEAEYFLNNVELGMTFDF